MSQDMISVIDVAHGQGKKKSTIFRVLRRLGVTPPKRRDSTSGNQLVAYITIEESELVVQELLGRSKRLLPEVGDRNQNSDESISSELGVFYLIQLEPEHDPGRFKVGFAASMPERLRQLRCSAPFASVVQKWPCRRLWEKTAIDCVSIGCEQLHTEVFRATVLEQVVARCQRFFDIMPVVMPTDEEESLSEDESEHRSG